MYNILLYNIIIYMSSPRSIDLTMEWIKILTCEKKCIKTGKKIKCAVFFVHLLYNIA